MRINIVNVSNRRLVAVFLFLSLLAIAVGNGVALADTINVTGAWTGLSFTGGSQFPNSFSLLQNGNVITGATEASGFPGTITGQIVNGQISFHSDFPGLNYSSDAAGVTDGKTMSGNFVDSQKTTGTFSLQKSQSILSPSTKLPNPPIVATHKNSVVITFVKFSKVVRTASHALTGEAASAAKLAPKYLLKIRGRERLNIVSARNSVTVKNLRPGTYTASYRVSAVNSSSSGSSSNSTVYTTPSSPTAKFTIRTP